MFSIITGLIFLINTILCYDLGTIVFVKPSWRKKMECFGNNINLSGKKRCSCKNNNNDYKEEEYTCFLCHGASLVAYLLKNPPANAGDTDPVLDWEDSLGEGMATQYSEIPWTDEPGWLQSIGWQRVRHDWACMHTHTCVIILTYN